MAVGNRKQDCLDCLKGHPSKVGTEAYFRKNNLVFFEWKTSSKVFFTQVFSSHNCHEIVSEKNVQPHLDVVAFAISLFLTTSLPTRLPLDNPQ